MSMRHQLIEQLTGVQSSKRNYYTELKKTVMKMQKKNLQLEIINDMMKSLNVEMSMDEMLKNILDKLKTMYEFDSISLSICQGETLVLTNFYPNEHDAMNHQLHDRSIYGRALDSGKMLYHTFEEETETVSASDQSLKSMLVFPLYSKGTVIGVLGIGSKGIIEYDKSDGSFLQQLSDHFSVCLENARLYNEVLNAKKEWEDTFSAVTDLIFVLNLKGEILKVNASAKDYLQLKDAEETGRNIRLFLNHNEIEALMEDCLQKKKAALQEIRRADGQIFETTISPVLNEKKQMYGLILYLRNVSAKRKMEAQLVQSGKLAAIGELAAGVAHELNNPLTAILGNSQLLLRTANKDEPSYRLLTDIVNCGKRSKSIIQNLLTFSRQDEYFFEECSLNEVIDQYLSLIVYQIEKQNVRVEVVKQSPLPKINGNQKQIGQIMINLLLNAKDALENRSEKNKKVTISTASCLVKGKEWICLSVTDNGIGISDKQIQEIFHPFITTKKEGKGTGLGLSVSLGIAQAHGGTIEVKSEMGLGSTFTLFLPAIMDE